ncbi:formyltransferase family protein [Chitinophagaceae bacterium 26-R-25]|nr:formyltransferase family protein [Chitinophagaceae bacterium 26-R-25]
MKVIILTSSRYGTAAHHIPYLIESGSCEISMVVLSDGIIKNKNKHRKRKLQKVFKIGILGALNGIRMRKWFNEDMEALKKIDELESLCKEKNIPFYTTPNVNSRETVELFQKSNADLGLSLGNGYIGKKIFSIPKYGMLNIHHEKLPEYQNAQSIIWQIYNMSDKTGFTIHKIDDRIDTGEILLQEPVPIIFSETLRKTVAKTSVALLEASAKGLVKVLKDFDNLFKNSLPQGKGHSYTTPSIWQFIRIHKNYKKLRRKSGQ